MTKINIGDSLKLDDGDIMVIDKKKFDDAPAFLAKRVIIYKKNNNLHFISEDLNLYFGQQLSGILIPLKQVVENNRIIYVDDLAKVRLI